jgi:putative transposase
VIDLVISRVQDLKIFKRNKIPLRKKVITTLLYFLGLSYRDLSRLLGMSHEAARLWFTALKDAFPAPTKKKRRHIAVDETKIKLNSAQIFVWAAIDCETKELLGIKATKGRSTADAYFFLLRIKKLCKGRTVCHVDGGPWYIWAAKKVGFIYERTVGGLRNAAEQFFSIFKERTKRFWNIFRSWDGVDNFVAVYMGFYNLWRC